MKKQEREKVKATLKTVDDEVNKMLHQILQNEPLEQEEILKAFEHWKAMTTTAAMVEMWYDDKIEFCGWNVEEQCFMVRMKETK